MRSSKLSAYSVSTFPISITPSASTAPPKPIKSSRTLMKDKEKLMQAIYKQGKELEAKRKMILG